MDGIQFDKNSASLLGTWLPPCWYAPIGCSLTFGEMLPPMGSTPVHGTIRILRSEVDCELCVANIHPVDCVCVNLVILLLLSRSVLVPLSFIAR